MKKDRDLAMVQYLIPKADDKRITASQIHSMAGVSPFDVRKCVNTLRQSGVPVCSDKKGYYITENSENVNATIVQLRHRISAMQNAINGLEKWQANMKKEG